MFRLVDKGMTWMVIDTGHFQVIEVTMISFSKPTKFRTP